MYSRFSDSTAGKVFPIGVGRRHRSQCSLEKGSLYGIETSDFVDFLELRYSALTSLAVPGL